VHARQEPLRSASGPGSLSNRVGRRIDGTKPGCWCWQRGLLGDGIRENAWADEFEDVFLLISIVSFLYKARLGPTLHNHRTHRGHVCRILEFVAT
jgi:hypothetical protein